MYYEKEQIKSRDKFERRKKIFSKIKKNIYNIYLYKFLNIYI